MGELDVVVVDDDFLVVKVHTRFVESVPGFRVVATAATGQQALDAALVEAEDGGHAVVVRPLLAGPPAP